MFLLPAGKKTESPCQALVRNRLGFRGVLTQAQEGSLYQETFLGEPADGCQGQARAVGSVLGRCKRGGTGRNSPWSARVIRSVQGGREEVRELPQMCPAPLLSITPQH